MILPVATLAAALLAQVTAASPTAPAPPPTATNAAADPTVCRSIMDTGTRFSHRICHTASEWRQLSADAQSQVQQDQRLSSGSPR